MLNKKSRVPYYYQVKEMILEDIRTGRYRSGDKIPTETELAEMLDVSRPTIRQAMQELVSSGLLVREKGRGTFVRSPQFETDLRSLTPFVEEARSRGLVPSLKVVDHGIIDCSDSIANKLGISPGDPVFKAVRVRYADGHEMSLQTSYLIYRLFPGIEKTDLEQEPLAGVIRDKFGVNEMWADQRLYARMPDSSERKLLGITVEEPVIVWEGVIYDDTDTPCQFAKAVYPGERYRFRFRQYSPTYNS